MTQVRVSEARTSFLQAKSVQLSCPFCGALCEAKFPYGTTNEQRMKIRHEIISEHTKVCTVAGAEVLRVWAVEPPRA